VGDEVNLERAMVVGDRFGGHIVQGHVDGVGTVRTVETVDDAVIVDIDVPDEVAELCVPHGSITVNGVSLTVNEMTAPSVLQVSLIPFTLDNTTLGALRAGDEVHLEADIIGKYVRELLDRGQRAS
jgi:riboflavin synthase